MKTRKTWIITGTIGILGLGTGIRPQPAVRPQRPLIRLTHPDGTRLAEGDVSRPIVQMGGDISLLPGLSLYQSGF